MSLLLHVKSKLAGKFGEMQGTQETSLSPKPRTAVAVRQQSQRLIGDAKGLINEGRARSEADVEDDNQSQVN